MDLFCEQFNIYNKISRCGLSYQILDDIRKQKAYARESLAMKGASATCSDYEEVIECARIAGL